MIAYHCDSNAILAEPIKTWADKHCLIAYNSIMQRLKNRGMRVDLQILDNEASKAYKRTMTSDWEASSFSYFHRTSIGGMPLNEPFELSRLILFLF